MLVTNVLAYITVIDKRSSLQSYNSQYSAVNFLRNTQAYKAVFDTVEATPGSHTVES
jgi:hypothetical protein